MKNKSLTFKITLFVVALVAIMGIAMITVPIQHQVTYVYTQSYFGFRWYDIFDNGVYTQTMGIEPVPDNYIYQTHIINWHYPNPPTFDFSWLPFVN